MFVLFCGGDFVFAFHKHFEVQKQNRKFKGHRHYRCQQHRSEAEHDDSGSTHRRLMTFVSVIKGERWEN